MAKGNKSLVSNQGTTPPPPPNAGENRHNAATRPRRPPTTSEHQAIPQHAPVPVLSTQNPSSAVRNERLLNVVASREEGSPESEPMAVDGPVEVHRSSETPGTQLLGQTTTHTVIQYKFTPPYVPSNSQAGSSRTKPTAPVNTSSDDLSALHGSSTEKQSRREIEKRSQDKLQKVLRKCMKRASKWRERYSWIPGPEDLRGSADAVQFLLNIEDALGEKLQNIEKQQQEHFKSSQEKEKKLVADCESKDRIIISQAQKIKSLEERLAGLEKALATTLQLDASSSNPPLFGEESRNEYDDFERMILFPK
ncbi:hypothetical protein SISSUDRAFT_1131232 [Sistotremastrum suecicum HHB10207 ss-3]|uniref:Uncharacterized protein n=1 Tax=Sistotremastrum suecicum HHB10207 ss-3 TaxID=1314776 RepID=A0A166AGC6_9AGAM|nr:hypothetical protein SISSUDRAFT_1131232 [Sistotremastrum suecicum HHB10207 ss-3]